MPFLAWREDFFQDFGRFPAFVPVLCLFKMLWNVPFRFGDFEVFGAKILLQGQKKHGRRRKVVGQPYGENGILRTSRAPVVFNHRRHVNLALLKLGI